MDKYLEESTTPKEYKDLANVFSPSNSYSLPTHRDEDHAIELELGKTPLFGLLYNLSEYQLKTLREYMDKNLANRFISPSKSSAGAPVLFTPKLNRTLRFCVDYRRWNSMTIKSWYLLSLINEILDRLSYARVFTKIDWRIPTIAFDSERVMSERPLFKYNTDYLNTWWCHLG